MFGGVLRQCRVWELDVHKLHKHVLPQGWSVTGRDEHFMCDEWGLCIRVAGVNDMNRWWCQLENVEDTSSLST